MKALWLFVAGLFANAAMAAPPTHCGSKERTYFSCTLVGSKKVASLCGEPNAHEGTWFQYRFGVLQRPEMVYPKQKEGSSEKFFAHFERHPEGGFREIWFRVGAYEYLVASEYSVESGEKENNHVVVYRDLKPIANLQCAGAVTNDLGFLRPRILDANEDGFFKAR